MDFTLRSSLLIKDTSVIATILLQDSNVNLVPDRSESEINV